jgi:hypothetical protein
LDEIRARQALYSLVLDHGDDAPIPDPYLSPRTASSPTDLNEASKQPQTSSPSAARDQVPPGASPSYEAAVRSVLESPATVANPAAGTPPEAPVTPAAVQGIVPFRAVPGSPYATWALVVGVLGIICIGAGPILGVIAMGLGVLGWRQVSRSDGVMRGRLSAGLGIAAGIFSIVFFVGEVALYLSLARPLRAASSGAANGRGAQDPPGSLVPSGDDDPGAGAQGTTTDPPSTTSTVTTVGNITVVDVALGVSSLSSELRQQHAEASAHGERLLLETTSADCAPCQGVATALSDPRMQNALDHVRLVRVDREPFEEDLAELQIPSRPFPGFFLLDSDLRVSDGINGGEWDDDIAINIAPVLGPFVRGTYVKRRSPWKKLPRPGGTVL